MRKEEGKKEEGRRLGRVTGEMETIKIHTFMGKDDC